MKTDDRTLARGLAWFGIGLGVVELLAPRQTARAIGLEGHERTLQLFGLREIVSGVAMLATEAPEERIGLRVGGDVLDGGLLSAGLRSSNPHRARTLMAALAVAPVVVLDTACWVRTRDGPRSLTRDGRRKGQTALPPDDNLDHYALGYYAPGKGLGRQSCPYAEGMDAHDLWLAGYDAASRGEKIEDRPTNRA